METLTPFYVVAALFLIIGGMSVGAQVVVCFVGLGTTISRSRGLPYSPRHYVDTSLS